MRIFRTRSLLIFAMLALVILPMLQSQQVIAQDLKSQADQFIDVLEKNDEFTGIAFLAKGDEILYQRTGGMAVYEWDIPIGTDTRFCLASVSKQFTAAAILILEQDEKLKVEDSISNFFPDFPNGEQITIHQLLTHTSGIPNFTDFKEWMTENKVPLEVDSLVADLATREPDFKPGTAFKYSNSGYAMLGRIIELASGQSYDAFLKARIFEPLKMKDSGTFSGNPTVQNLAFGYAGGSKGYQPAELIDLSQGFGAGHIYSTVEDMY
ncbi:MAG: serine hydrolase domain-containing protein, partial [Bacteroidota bacterium]